MGVRGQVHFSKFCVCRSANVHSSYKYPQSIHDETLLSSLLFRSPSPSSFSSIFFLFSFLLPLRWRLFCKVRIEDEIDAQGQDPRGRVPQVSAWLEREREDVVAVTDGGGKGGRGIERGEERGKRREEQRREEKRAWA